MNSFIYFTPLFLYFPRVLPGVETQPLLATGIALVSLLWGRQRRAALAFVGLIWGLLLWIAIKTMLDSSPSSALGLMQLLGGPLVLFGALALRAPPPSRRMMAAVSVYFLACALFEMAAPGAYGGVASSLLSRASVADGHRGVSLFTPEPTYAAISVAYFLVLAWWSGLHWGFRHRFVEPALAVCLFATGSTYVGLLLLALAFVRWPRAMLLGTTALVGALSLIDVVALDNDESVRAVVAVSRLLSSDFGNFLPSISLVDSSLGSRFTTNAASFLTPLHSPLGLGLGCSAVPSAFDAAGFDFAYDNAVLAAVIDDGCLKPQSYAAAVALGLGALSFVFFPLLVALCRFARGRRRVALWTTPLALAAVMLVMQGQLTNPIPWLLIFLALSGRSGHQRHHRVAITTPTPHATPRLRQNDCTPPRPHPPVPVSAVRR